MWGHWANDHASMIAYCDGFIDPRSCQTLIDELIPVWGEVSFDGKTAGGVMPSWKQTEDVHLGWELGPYYTTRIQQAESHIVRGVAGVISWYRSQYRWLGDWPVISDSGFQLQRYRQAHGYYREHVDSNPGLSTYSKRVLALVIYLNDVSSGGETYFPQHGVSIQPVAGRVAVFPALWTHPHVAQPPLSGDKYIISTFIERNDMDVAPVTVADQQSDNHHDHEHDHHHDVSPRLDDSPSVVLAPEPVKSRRRRTT